MIPQPICEYGNAMYSCVEALPISQSELSASGLRQTVSSQLLTG
jgi:hypothetical protein